MTQNGADNTVDGDPKHHRTEFRFREAKLFFLHIDRGLHDRLSRRGVSLVGAAAKIRRAKIFLLFFYQPRALFYFSSEFLPGGASLIENLLRNDFLFEQLLRPAKLTFS